MNVACELQLWTFLICVFCRCEAALSETTDRQTICYCWLPKLNSNTNIVVVQHSETLLNLWLCDTFNQINWTARRPAQLFVHVFEQIDLIAARIMFSMAECAIVRQRTNELRFQTIHSPSVMVRVDAANKYLPINNCHCSMVDLIYAPKKPI